MRQRIFVGSSGEAMSVCRAVQQELDRDFDVTIWDQGVFRLTYGAVDSLCAALDSSDAGIFVLTPDDLTESRGHSNFTVRDNVIFELGMFLGRLGRENVYMLAPAKSPVRLPSDLIGITAAHYDAERFDRQQRAAVGPACTRITQAIKSVQPEISQEPRFRARLDRAISRLSNDLEDLIADGSAIRNDSNVLWPGEISFRLGRATVHIEAGRIQDYHPADKRTVIVLPANEYFDDACISDSSGSLGAFAQAHFENRIAEFTDHIRAALDDVPSQRVARSEHQIAESYGVGQAILLNGLEPEYCLILAAVTNERAGVGLHAEPHFIYAAMERIVEIMNERRLNSLVMPVLGSGHGEIPLSAAILFNLLAIRSILNDDRGRHAKEIRLVIFDGNAPKITSEDMNNILSRVGS